MGISSSLLQDLLQDLPHLRSQMYFKPALTALSHAMEDLVLAGSGSPLVIANFQRERFYRQEVRRYQKIAQHTDQVYVLAPPEEESGFATESDAYACIALEPNDGLAHEWHLIILGQQYAACLVCREQIVPEAPMDQARRFEGIWTFDRQVCAQAAKLLLGRIAIYNPRLTPKIEQAWQRYGLTVEAPESVLVPKLQALHSSIFGQRLMTYLQASQYKLLKTYRALADQARKERLINVMTVAIRSSLEPQAVLETAVQELGLVFEHCRCLLYPCDVNEPSVQIEYEFVAPGWPALLGESWGLADNPLIQVAMLQDRATAIAEVANAPLLETNPALKKRVKRYQIQSWLLVPIRYQGQLVGMIELHQRGPDPYQWREHDISLVEAIATQAGVALTQAQAYFESATLNRQLEALEQTRTNLIAIVGHELRTPLSTIQVCLESLDSEPDMPLGFRQVMLNTALEDSARLQKLIQNFLTLSRLEAGQGYGRSETVHLLESLEVVLSALKANWPATALPTIIVELTPELPAVRADQEGVGEVLMRLLENACKFTDPAGNVVIRARPCPDQRHLEVIVADTGRGIEPNQLENIFNTFYQEEGFLQRTVGGVGLGLAICRQIVQNMGGEIWAKSAGRDQGSAFHFTVPIESSRRVQSPF
ncbi:MAG: GAF domain-containing protein [Cyanothece sp. SIO1E1]|nr:GAF domain-containing protein [Cyanothece sp. SIO1E1]